MPAQLVWAQKQTPVGASHTASRYIFSPAHLLGTGKLTEQFQPKMYVLLHRLPCHSHHDVELLRPAVHRPHG